MRSKILFSAACGAAVAACWSQAAAEPTPRTLDAALVETLSLGNPAGCGAAFGLPASATHDADLVALRVSGQLQRELVAICGSSAVTSAAALGGSLGSLQTTKTVSQFRMARNRADSRLDARGKRASLDEPNWLAQVSDRYAASSTPALAAQDAADTGVGVFVQLGNERRNRVNTALEAGYKASINEAVVGVDYATRDQLVAGLWVGYRGADADYRNAQALIGGGDAAFRNSLDASTQAEICKLGPGGGFDDKGSRWGVFVAKRLGDAFADVGAQYSRRNYGYQRNVCAIEAQGAITRDANPQPGDSGFVHVTPTNKLDDIYAGSIAGKASLTEFGFTGRGGVDFRTAQFQWGPRLALTYLRTALGAYQETGRTSVTNTVNSVGGIQTTRTAGNPTGLELAFDKQHRSSLQSELQVQAATRYETGAGSWVPRVSAAWVHEFKGERQLVAVRMAQDLRAAPTRFSFTTDSVDKNKFQLALGLSLLRGPGFVADVEVTRLEGDQQFTSTAFTAQARWRF